MIGLPNTRDGRRALATGTMSLIQSHTGPCVVNGDCVCSSNYLMPADACGPNNASSNVYANAEVCHINFTQPVYLDIHLWDVELDDGGCRWDSLRSAAHLEPRVSCLVLIMRTGLPCDPCGCAALTERGLTTETHCGSGTARSTATRT